MTTATPLFPGLVETFPGNLASFAREGLVHDEDGAHLVISKSPTGNRPYRSGAFASGSFFEHGRFEAEIMAARGSGLITGFFLHRDAPRQEIDIELAGETIARVDAGRALSVFASDGALLRALELPAGAPLMVPFQEAVYELKGRSPCVNVATDNWTDLAPVLSAGSWVATLPDVGSVVIETVFPDARGVRADGRELVAGDLMRTTGPTRNDDGSEMVVTELTRAGGPRPVFRLALDRRPASVRARLKPGATHASVELCADPPVNSLFHDGRNLAPFPVYVDRAKDLAQLRGVREETELFTLAPPSSA